MLLPALLLTLSQITLRNPESFSHQRTSSHCSLGITEPWGEEEGQQSVRNCEEEPANGPQTPSPSRPAGVCSYVGSMQDQAPWSQPQVLCCLNASSLSGSHAQQPPAALAWVHCGTGIQAALSSAGCHHHSMAGHGDCSESPEGSRVPWEKEQESWGEGEGSPIRQRPPTSRYQL